MTPLTAPLSFLGTPIYAAALLFVLLAVAEWISIASRAWIPSMLVAFVGYIALMWSHVAPTTIATVATLGPAGSVLIGVLIAHMGTMIPLARLKEQWRAVVIALSGMVLVTLLVLGVISPAFGYHTAAASAGPVTGGIVAFLITSEKIKTLGKASLLVVPVLVLALHSLIGMPIANVLLRRYAVQLRDRGTYATTAAATPAAAAPGDDESRDPELEETVADQPRKQLIPVQYRTPPILLAILLVLAAVAQALDHLTGINYGIWALAFGIAAHAVGLVPARTLEHANSFGLAMNLIVIVVVSSMNTLTPAALKAAIVPAAAVIAVALTGLIVAGFAASKLVRWSPLKGIPVALTALFGFPADYLICQEVSSSVGRTEAEREGIMSDIYTPMLIGGFATVTTSSVIVASILMSTL